MTLSDDQLKMALDAMKKNLLTSGTMISASLGTTDPTYVPLMSPTPKKPKPQKKKKGPRAAGEFRVGDKIQLRKGVSRPTSDAHFEIRCVHPEDGGMVFIFPQGLGVVGSDCSEHGTTWEVSMADIELVTPVKTKKKVEKLDHSHLEKVSLKPEVRKDIVAALAQGSKRELIFDTWGLGETIEYGRGLSFLFWGPPGTGKTWTARCIARAVGRELMTVTVGQIQSSLAGETNKNIEKAFKAAKEGDKVLFLDEADSFIGDRKYLGMILSSEINTLLQEIEKFEGIVILATNMIGSLDPALERRLALIVEFKNPTLEERKDIWKMILPKKFPMDKDVTVDALAEHKLTGGLIKNVLLHAARLAAADGHKSVGMAHFTTAITRVREGQGKMGTRGMQAVVDYHIGGSL